MRHSYSFTNYNMSYSYTSADMKEQGGGEVTNISYVINSNFTEYYHVKAAYIVSWR